MSIGVFLDRSTLVFESYVLIVILEIKSRTPQKPAVAESPSFSRVYEMK